MPKIVSFADGFSTSTPPSVESAGQEVFPILNNQSVAQLLEDISPYTSLFAQFELERMVTGTLKRQVGEFIISYNGATYDINIGNYQGDNLIRTAAEGVTLPEEIVLQVSGAGLFQYLSGNMVGAAYVGNLKMQLTRVLA